MRGAPGNLLLTSSVAVTVNGKFAEGSAAASSASTGRIVIRQKISDRDGAPVLRFQREDFSNTIDASMSQPFARARDEPGHIGDREADSVQIAGRAHSG